jgi:hypothetical protein
MDLIWETAPGLGARKYGDLEGVRGGIILRTFLLQPYPLMRLTKPRRELARKHYGSAEDRSRDEALNASEELFSQRYDDAPWTPHVAQPVQLLVLGHFAEEFGAEVGAHASDSLIDAFDCKHDAPEAQRVRRCDQRFDLDTFEPVDAVHPLSLYRRLSLQLQTELGKESDSGCKVVDDDAEVVQSLDRHVPSIGQAERDVHRAVLAASV